MPELGFEDGNEIDTVLKCEVQDSFGFEKRAVFDEKG